jgi:hypothetical protein
LISNKKIPKYLTPLKTT